MFSESDRLCRLAVVFLGCTGGGDSDRIDVFTSARIFLMVAVFGKCSVGDYAFRSAAAAISVDGAVPCLADCDIL